MNYRKREILGLTPKKNLTRNRKTEYNELPELNSAGHREFAAFKNECADAIGAVRWKGRLILPKVEPNSTLDAARIRKDTYKSGRRFMRELKREKHALNSGKRLQVKLWRKEKKQRAANGF